MMNKPSFYSLILILVLSACSNQSEHRELLKIRKENALLKKKLDRYNQDLIITPENMHKYVGALAYGPASVKTNESFSTYCHLYLHDLPLKIDCIMDQENQSVKTSGKISHSIQSSFPGSGERIFSGEYIVTFPNGKKWSIPWENRVMVK